MCLWIDGFVVFPVTHAYLTASQQYPHFSRVSVFHCMTGSSKSAQRAVFQFLPIEKEYSSQVYRKMKVVYGEQCFVRWTIFRWCQYCEAESVNLKELACLGQVHVMFNSATILAVDELILQNYRITTREIFVELLISNGIV